MSKAMGKIPVVLTIGGSDPSGGAGIQGDLKTIQNHKAFGMAVITALTAQNTMGVYGVEAISHNMFKAQMAAIYGDEAPDSIKISMISKEETLNALINILKDVKQSHVVYDPVLVSSSGTVLSPLNLIDHIKKKLLPLVDLVTPNIMEAQVLSGMEITCPDHVELVAKELYKYVRSGVLIKGGHLTELNEESRVDKEVSRDFLYLGEKGLWLESKRVDSDNTHGTGCCLSTAIACNLAYGLSLNESVERAKSYLNQVISIALPIGKGKKSVNHLAPFMIKDNH